MDEVNLRVSFRRTGCGVDVVATKITAKLERILNVDVGKVLVTESFTCQLNSASNQSKLTNDLLLGYKQCKFVFALVREFRQLNAANLSSDIRGQVLDLGILEEIWEGGVCVFPVVIVLEEFKRWVPNIMFSWSSCFTLQNED